MTFLEVFLQVSLTGSALIAVALLLSHLMGKNLAAKYRRLIWIVIAIRLLLPIGVPIAEAPVTVTMPDLQTPIYARPAAIPQTMHAAGPAPEQTAPQAAPATAESTPWIPSLSQAILLLWASGATIAICLEVAGHFRAKRRILRWRRQPDQRMRMALSAVCADMGIGQDIDLLVSKTAHTPMLLGLFHPTLVFPDAPYEDADLALILRHELTHLARHDLWYKLAMMAVRALHWFNPLAYIMYRRADEDMEFACDDAVMRALGAGHNRRYGETILMAACAGGGRTATLSTHFHGGKKNLARRIRNIMQTKKRRLGAFVLVAVLLAAVTGGALVGFAAAPSESPAQTSALQDTYGLLLGLRFDGYEDMTVSAFRDAAHIKMAEDEAAYLALYDHYNESMWRLRYDDEDAFFLFNTLIPLTGDSWKNWRFAYYAANPANDIVSVEYALQREVLDPDTLTVGEHMRALRGMVDGIATLAETYIYQPNPDNDAFLAGLTPLAARYSNNAIAFHVTESTIIPEEFTEAKNTGDPEATAQSATSADYDLLLALKTDDYLDLSVEAFTAQVQAAFSDERAPIQSAYERVRRDISNGTVPDTITPEEVTFLSLTLETSIREYVAAHQSQYTETANLPTYQATFYGDETIPYGVAVTYAFAYDILDGEALTVRARDAQLTAVMDGMDQALQEGLWDAGMEAMEMTLHQLADENSMDRLIQFTPLEIYSDVDRETREILAREAYALIETMRAVDTSLSVEEYARRIEAIGAELGTNIYDVMATASEIIDVDDPLYAYETGALMHTSSELFAAQMGGEERSYASTWFGREKYEDASVQVEALRAEMDAESYEALAEAMKDAPPNLVYLVQAHCVFFYDIAAPASFSVDAREARLDAMKADAYAFMDSLSEEELLDDGLEARFAAELERLAAVQSDNEMTIEVELQHIERIGEGMPL